jgi:hypothetical protein
MCCIDSWLRWHSASYPSVVKAYSKLKLHWQNWVQPNPEVLVDTERYILRKVLILLRILSNFSEIHVKWEEGKSDFVVLRKYDLQYSHLFHSVKHTERTLSKDLLGVCYCSLFPIIKPVLYVCIVTVEVWIWTEQTTRHGFHLEWGLHL